MVPKVSYTLYIEWIVEPRMGTADLREVVAVVILLSILISVKLLFN